MFKRAFTAAALTIFILLNFSTPVSPQSFKIIISPFEDRTGTLAKTEGEVKASIQAGVIVGNNSGVGTASGQRTNSSLESGKGDLGLQASDILVTALIKSDNFKIIDYNKFLNKLNEIGNNDYNEAAKLAGAHYYVTGNITEAGVSETGGSLLGFGGKSVEGKVHVNIMMANTATGEVVLAEGADGTQSEGGLTLFGSDISSKNDLGLLISAALRVAIDSCAGKIQDAVGDLYNYPVECDIALSEGKVYFSKGSDDGIRAGDTFQVIGFGKPIKIGNKIIQEKNTKGIITITEVFNDYATAAPDNLIINEGDIAAKVISKNVRSVTEGN